MSPDPAPEGGEATISGSGFGSAPEENRVLVDGREAEILSASATRLVVRVPTSACRPDRPGVFRVEVAGVSTEVSHRLAGAGERAETVAVGNQRILGDPDRACIQFPEGEGAEAYLVGIQAVPPDLFQRNVADSLRLRVTTATPEGSASGSVLPRGGGSMGGTRGAGREAPGRSGTARSLDPVAEAWFRARHVELRYRLSEERHLLNRRVRGLVATLHDSGRPAARTSAHSFGAAAVPATAKVGDLVDLRLVGEIFRDPCSSFTPVQGVVRSVGRSSIWVEDSADPPADLSPAEYAALDDLFDAELAHRVIEYLGEPSDTDGNGRVVMVLSRRVPGGGLVSKKNVFTREGCAGSDEGEYVYLAPPDAPGWLPKEAWLGTIADVLAHETAHVIQFARRLLQQPSVDITTFLAEGQATLVEEAVRLDLTRRTRGGNYGAGHALAGEWMLYGIDHWLFNALGGLANHFGYWSPTEIRPGAPERCGWLGFPAQEGGPEPCGGFEVYGTSWSLLRWISDHRGPGHAGGEAGIHRAILDSRRFGFESLEDALGESLAPILARWSASLYLDDRLAEVDPELTLLSWNLREIYEALWLGRGLEPRERPFETFDEPLYVRLGSAAYYRLSGEGRPATALRVTGRSGEPLPSTEAQVWIVRLR